MDAYWRFAAARHDLYLRRVAALPPVPCPDPVLSRYRFTNAFRVCDRVSQYLVREVQYAHDQSAEEVVFRTVLFKLFNKIDTWELLCDGLGVPSVRSFDPAAASALLSEEQRQGRAVYSAAYIVPPVSLYPTPKHRGHLELVALMLDNGLAEKARGADGLRGLYRLLKSFPGMGPFLAFQLAIDLNYSSAVDFDEAECVVAGPGALDGISKCSPETHPRDAERFIVDVCARQEDEFARLGLEFPGLFGRRLQPIDCQNLFCEISKYSRVAFPDVAGVAGRTRIKQRYSAAGPLPAPFFPPKWGLDVPAAVRGGAAAAPVRRPTRRAAELALF
ncbi:nucleotide kinase domain-containing protein [Candidatus Blastococcus massiliensis]|uniref:nucleotide kinase domain-containing protein n=1 Tax=Candidatus Blastococcus massiliensis TaxID=1470358 RepID=UPI0018CC3549|nr:nucleotide kinase domain-containing protein [Candidatus Blastococcus massiliensis]